MPVTPWTAYSLPCATSNPQVYACVQQIDTFLHGTYGWQCSKEEQLYLIMHIHRVCVERAED